MTEVMQAWDGGPGRVLPAGAIVDHLDFLEALVEVSLPGVAGADIAEVLKHGVRGRGLVRRAVAARTGVARRGGAAGVRGAGSTAGRRGADERGSVLAFPANQAQRNSINDVGSLLRVLCGTSEATHCRGPTAAQAEFRTGNGTWSRAEGLLLIVAGALGLILLLGFIALHLLKAAIMSLFYLLLAPAAQTSGRVCHPPRGATDCRGAGCAHPRARP